jgi:uncharacterized protein (TIGR02646 family)
MEPASLVKWKRSNPSGTYKDLSKDKEIRHDISMAALGEQNHLCAYCCVLLDRINDCHNEHVEPQNIARNLTTEFSNIVVSCNTNNQCGKAHDSERLLLTPFMVECETELKFYISGRVEGLSERAKAAIKVLNLGDSEQNNRKLIEKRKRLVDGLLWKNGIDPSEGFDDEKLVKRVMDDISQPKNGKLESFAPVLANILKNYFG